MQPHLARVECREAAVGKLDDQVPAARRFPRRPRHRRASRPRRRAERRAARHAASDLSAGAAEPALEQLQQAREGRLDVASGASPSVPALRARSSGSALGSSATLIPIPSTAQSLLRAALDEDAADLAASASSTSLGHFRRACGPTSSATATPAAIGSSGGGSRSTSEQSSAWPAGACQWRPWRPRPASCSAAVTSVPCGAPAAASSRASTLVEPVLLRWTRGCAERAAHAARSAHFGVRVLGAPATSAAPSRALIASASAPRAST